MDIQAGLKFILIVHIDFFTFLRCVVNYKLICISNVIISPYKCPYPLNFCSGHLSDSDDLL